MKAKIKKVIEKVADKYNDFMMWLERVIFPFDDLVGVPRKIHEIKCEIEFFDDVVNDFKTFEIRKNDRDYQPGDNIILKEWDKGSRDYTGREERVAIIYLLENYPGIEAGYCILGIERY